MVNGDLSVREDSDLRVCAGASAEVHGMVSGDVLLATGAHASVHGGLIGGRMREVEPNAF